MSSPIRDWSRAVLTVNSSIEQVIHVLNEVAIRIVLITNEMGVLVGTISDGDIRRGLLKGLNLESSAEAIMHCDALVVPPDLSRELVLQLMISSKIQQIPIVDENKRVIGLHLWDEVSAPPTCPNTMVIMAGGKGTRLHPQTDNCPKPLLPIGGKPILEHIINRAKAEGFSHFVLSIFYLGHMIEEYFGDGKRFGVKIEYLREEIPLGTAGSLTLLDPLPESAVVVTNGDVLTDVRYGDILNFHIINKATATMAVRTHEWQNPFGVVKAKGLEIVEYEEKPTTKSYVNAGVYVLEPHIIRLLQRGKPIDMPFLIEKIIKSSGKLVAFPIHENWLDVGSPENLKIAQKIELINGNE